MKRCPTCTRVYDGGDLRFCLDDGTLLVDKPSESPAPPTLVLPVQENQPTMTAAQPPQPVRDHIPPTVASPRKQKRSLLVWIIVVAILIPLLGGAGLGSWAVFHKKPLAWHLVLQVYSNTSDHSAAMRQTVAVIEKRLDAAGVRNYEVKPQDAGDSGRIVINLPKVDDPERIKQLITTLGKLELVHVISPPSPAPVQTYTMRGAAIDSLNSTGSIPENRRVIPYTERDESAGSNRNPEKWVVIESPAIIGGNDLRTADAVQYGGEIYNVAFSLNKDGADKFGKWTAANINQYLGVVLNDEVKSIAYIKSQISDQGEISGRFTKQAAEDLALVLKSGALPAPVSLVEERVDK